MERTHNPLLLSWKKEELKEPILRVPIAPGRFVAGPSLYGDFHSDGRATFWYSKMTARWGSDIPFSSIHYRASCPRRRTFSQGHPFTFTGFLGSPLLPAAAAYDQLIRFRGSNVIHLRSDTRYTGRIVYDLKTFHWYFEAEQALLLPPEGSYSLAAFDIVEVPMSYLGNRTYSGVVGNLVELLTFSNGGLLTSKHAISVRFAGRYYRFWDAIHWKDVDLGVSVCKLQNSDRVVVATPTSTHVYEPYPRLLSDNQFGFGWGERIPRFIPYKPEAVAPATKRQKRQLRRLSWSRSRSAAVLLFVFRNPPWWSLIADYLLLLLYYLARPSTWPIVRHFIPPHLRKL
jgi:hypothetical protein